MNICVTGHISETTSPPSLLRRPTIIKLASAFHNWSASESPLLCSLDRKRPLPRRAVHRFPLGAIRTEFWCYTQSNNSATGAKKRSGLSRFKTVHLGKSIDPRKPAQPPAYYCPVVLSGQRCLSSATTHAHQEAHWKRLLFHFRTDLKPITPTSFRAVGGGKTKLQEIITKSITEYCFQA